MNTPLTFDALRAANVGRVPAFGHTLQSWTALEWAGAMCGESGEAANCAKKLRRLDDDCTVNNPGKAALVEKLAEELADTIIYADLLAAREGIDLGAAVVKKWNEVSARVGHHLHL